METGMICFMDPSTTLFCTENQISITILTLFFKNLEILTPKKGLSDVITRICDVREAPF